MRLATLLAFFLLFGLFHEVRAEPPLGIKKTPLDDYVHKPDSAYKWEVAKSAKVDTFTVHMIKLTSQGWRTEKDVDRVLWEHWLIVTVPEKVAFNKAFLMIGGGGNDRPMPNGVDPMVGAIAKETSSVVAELKMVPNQPLVFHQDGKKRSEDDLIGYAWSQFLDSGDPTWLPRLPMVKSVVRAMDCIQEFLGSKPGGEIKIEKFVLAGGSKRGWTTWMAGAADARAAAIIPIVIDVANVDKSLRHHAAVYGFWATAIGNYYEHGIMQRIDHPKLSELYRIVDPYYYFDRLTMPKFVVNASGDQFFCPDSSQFYYDDLRGEKLLRYVPNADHSLKNSDAVQSLIAYYQTILNDRPRPKVTWKFEDNGSIRVKSDRKPIKAELWQANNPNARDFRLEKIGPAFKNSPVESNGEGEYVAQLSEPKEGWTAAFVELSFDVGGTQPLKTTTAVRVIPNILPFANVDPKTLKYEQEVK